MKAIVIKEPGGPEKLVVRDVPEPQPKPGCVIIEVCAFGINQAEIHMRQGDWPEIDEISGIECVGRVKMDPDGKLAPGQKVAALMGGMGRTIHGSYAEYTNVPATNVVPLDTDLPWSELAAVPESYATAWACLHGNLELRPGQTLVIRGATSALGQAALNIAVHAGAHVIATTRNRDRFAKLEALGAKGVLEEGPGFVREVRQHHPEGVDAVLDLVGNSVVLDSLQAVRRRGRVCEAGWLGGLAPIASSPWPSIHPAEPPPRPAFFPGDSRAPAAPGSARSTGSVLHEVPAGARARSDHPSPAPFERPGCGILAFPG